MTMTRSKPIPVRCIGGPFDGWTGDTVHDEPPAVVHLGDGHGFGYRLEKSERLPGGIRRAVYRYSPKDSPAHAAVVNADREAIMEVAATEGVPVREVLGRAQERRAAAKGGPHPAQMFLEECERLGADPATLLEERGELQTWDD